MSDHTDKPRPRIVITSADIENRKKRETDLSNVDTRHPFDRPEFREFLNKEFPEYENELDTAKRPIISTKPNDLEEWEARRILIRKDRMEGAVYRESDMAYLARLLYEETFSVNQEPGNIYGPTKDGSSGLTPGGLISHFYTEKIKRAYDLSPQGDNIREAITELKKRDNIQSSDLFAFTDAISVSRMPGSRGHDRLITHTDTASYPAEYDSVEFRLVRLLQARPDFFGEIKDDELKKRLGVPIKRNLTKIELLKAAWSRFQSLLTMNGTFATNRGENLKKDLNDFLFFRTHPETQIFYKFLSPSGYLNNKK